MRCAPLMKACAWRRVSEPKPRKGGDTMLTEVSRAGRADLYSIFRTRAQDCAGGDLAIEDGSKRLS